MSIGAARAQERERKELPIRGGEMARLIASADWSRTELGEFDGWSTSLRTMVGVVLASRFPMLLWWGPNLLQLYNDAYRPILGDKHPRSLGAPGAEVWSEIWHVLGPQALGVLAGGAATWNQDLLLEMNRKGFIEETYFTFSYSPVPDDSGRVGGVLVTCNETTERVLDARRLRVLRDLSARPATADSTVEEQCKHAARVFEDDRADIPFSLIYLLEEGGSSVRLAASAGLDGHPALQAWQTLSVGDPALPWPIDRALASAESLFTFMLDERTRPPGRAGTVAPQSAVCLPLARSGDLQPYGFLICGVSPQLEWDERYASFCRLAADQLVNAISREHALADERKRAEALAVLDRAKTQFFSNVSHEFRTPLTLMLGPTEDALRSTRGALEGQALELVYRNQRRLLRLVNSLLDFSRVEAKRVQATFQPTDLAKFTLELSSVFRSAIEQAGLTFVVRCESLQENVYVDRDLWEKIVLNLLSNAYKFTFEGGIEVDVKSAGPMVELRVRDTGTGIAPEELPHLFERFYRIEGVRARTHEGSGIGLSLVRELVHMHGGDIRVESAPGVGTRFVVSIPFGCAHLPSDRVSSSKSDAAASQAAEAFADEMQRWTARHTPANLPPVSPADEAELRGARIVVADDNADMLEYVARLLRQSGAMVTTVSDGEQAFAAAQREPVNLVVSDVMMPNLDGFGLLARLRRDPHTRDIPVLMLSARAGEDARIEGLEAGADDYLAKPFSARELIARVQLQLKLAEAHARVQRQWQKLAATLRQAPVAIAVWRGPEHVFELVNARYEELMDVHDVVGKAVREVFPPELDTVGVWQIWDRVYRTGEPFFAPEYEIPYTRSGEEPRPAFFAFSLSPLRSEGGEISGLVAVATEVTEQVIAREQIDAFRKEAERANRAKDEFLAMLGHELRNPLAPISTALSLMRLRPGQNVERERRVIERQVHHLTRLVDDLLDVARITQGKVRLNKGPIELADVIAKATEIASPHLESQRHHLEVSVPTSGLMVDADVVRLAQAISNLLTNAAKYTESRGRIVLSAEREQDRVLIRVADSGIGIPEEMLPHIFDLFVQNNQASDRARGGLGLGLAIARTFVTMHDGSISVESAGCGKGSTFTIRLPLLAEVGQAAPEREGVPHVRASCMTSPGKRVLVVDDNQDAAELLAELLGSFGCATRVALDGPEALRLTRDFAPDVAILDIGLPVMDGYELAAHLRESLGAACPKLVAVTGYGQPSDYARSQRAGFHAHLVKPVVEEALVSSLGLSRDGA